MQSDRKPSTGTSMQNVLTLISASIYNYCLTGQLAALCQARSRTPVRPPRNTSGGRTVMAARALCIPSYIRRRSCRLQMLRSHGVHLLLSVTPGAQRISSCRSMHAQLLGCSPEKSAAAQVVY